MKATTVSATAKQGAEAQPVNRWDWVEKSVWTDRMLHTLQTGVKGGKWFSLIDKVYHPANLESAAMQVVRNAGAAGVDHINVRQYTKRRKENLHHIHEALRDGTYHPQAIRRVTIPKPGSPEGRPLGIPTVQDRVVQTALRNVIEPIFEADFAEHSYGFRPRRGCKDALRRVQGLLTDGYLWVVDADLKSYFDTIPHDLLMADVRRKVSDGRVLGLIESFLRQEIMSDAAQWTPDKGTPQGAVISPLLANIYLNPLDHLAVDHGFEMVRYADDFVILCRDEDTAHCALNMVRSWTGARGLTLHPTKTKLLKVSTTQGFDFLGYHFRESKKYPGRIIRWPRTKSMQKLRDVMRLKTRRTNGHSLQAIIAAINPILRGFFEYFKHSRLRSFDLVDSWLRMRLRSILLKRAGGRGVARGRAHQRWKNAFFDGHGLFSLARAHDQLVQSSRR
jgi:RNA-directed DNA polymerase